MVVKLMTGAFDEAKEFFKQLYLSGDRFEKLKNQPFIHPDPPHER